MFVFGSKDIFSHMFRFVYEPELSIYSAFFSWLSQCCHFYIFGTRKIAHPLSLSLSLWVKAKLDVGLPP